MNFEKNFKDREENFDFVYFFIFRLNLRVTPIDGGPGTKK